jgi:hypothetical protein
MSSLPLPPRSRRIDTSYRAVLRDHAGAEIDALIVNLSRSGFRTSTNKPLAVGDRVLICSLEGDQYPAVIKWADGTEAGGEFLAPSGLPDHVGRLGK